VIQTFLCCATVNVLSPGQGGYVNPAFIYLSVGLSAGLHKKLLADLAEIFYEG